MIIQVRNGNIVKQCKLGSRNMPAQRSVKFLMRMLVAFFALMEPASRKANPACMSKMSDPMATRKKSSFMTINPCLTRRASSNKPK